MTVTRGFMARGLGRSIDAFFFYAIFIKMNDRDSYQDYS